MELFGVIFIIGAFCIFMEILILSIQNIKLKNENEAYSQILNAEIQDCDKLMEENFELTMQVAELKKELDRINANMLKTSNEEVKPKRTRKPRTKKEDK